MNRREFLVAIGATACAGTGPSVPSRRDDPASPTSVTKHALTVQLAPSPLAVHGDTLVQRAGRELWRWDATTMKRTGVLALEDLAAHAFLDDGTLVAYLESGDSCGVHAVRPDGSEQRCSGRVCGALAKHPIVLLRAHARDTLWVLGLDELELVRLAGAYLDRVTLLPFPRAHDPARGQTFSTDDGRVICPTSEGIAVLTADQAMQPYSTGDRRVQHLAQGAGGRFWYSYASVGATWTPDVLALASIETPLASVTTVDVTPARIVHIASRGDAIALLTVTRDQRWSVAMVDDTGRERWRTDVMAEHAHGFTLASVAAIALSNTRVVLRGLDDQLHAWDATNGAVLPVEPIVHAPR